MVLLEFELVVGLFDELSEACDRNGAFRIQQADNVSFRGCTLTWAEDVSPELNWAFALYDAQPPLVDGRFVLNDRPPSAVKAK